MKWIQLVVAIGLLGAVALPAGGLGVDLGPSLPGCRHASEIRRLVRAAIETTEFGESATSPPDENWCASVPPLPPEASLQVVNARWDAVLRSFEFRLRCQPPSICLPFLVRWPAERRHGSKETTFRPRTDPSKISGQTALPFLGIPVIKPGQSVTLVWQEGPLHLSRKVVCLDLGRVGQQVRTRPPQGGRIVRARVAGAGLVEAEL